MHPVDRRLNKDSFGEPVAQAQLLQRSAALHPKFIGAPPSPRPAWRPGETATLITQYLQLPDNSPNWRLFVLI